MNVYVSHWKYMFIIGLVVTQFLCTVM